MEKYEFVRFLGFGSFGAVKLMQNKETKELVAVKFIERDVINENVAREIINHRSLRHPNIVTFKEVVLTPTHLGIVMEYAAGAELCQRVFAAQRFSEDEARHFFQQLISGVNYCHSMQICHRDLKLTNTLLDGSVAPILKICDFGYSKSTVLHSMPDTHVGTLDYMAPELIVSSGKYDGKLTDVWSCGVTLYVMLVGAYPFGDKEEPRSWANTMLDATKANYMIPDNVDISEDCRHLLSRIFVVTPTKRITIEEIKHHPWFLKNLLEELTEADQGTYYREENKEFPFQSIDEIRMTLMEANGPALNALTMTLGGLVRMEEEKDDEQIEYTEVGGEKRRKRRRRVDLPLPKRWNFSLPPA